MMLLSAAVGDDESSLDSHSLVGLPSQTICAFTHPNCSFGPLLKVALVSQVCDLPVSVGSSLATGGLVSRVDLLVDSAD